MMLASAGHLSAATYPRSFSFSNEARFSEKASRTACSYRSRPLSVDRQKKAALSELREMVEESQHDDWDGEGAQAVNMSSVAKARKIINGLPTSSDMPSVGIGPDGLVVLEWITSRTRRLMITVTTSDRLPFAYMSGNNSMRGVGSYFGGELPPEVTEGLKRITNHGTSLRFAY